MTEGELRTMPSPRAVADLVDFEGYHAARARWGSLGANTLAKLVAEGRRLAGRTRPVGRTEHRYQSNHNLITTAWDGPDARTCRLPTHHAAAALGLSAATLTMGTA